MEGFEKALKQPGKFYYFIFIILSGTFKRERKNVERSFFILECFNIKLEYKAKKKFILKCYCTHVIGHLLRWHR